jgi:ABC-2 type transport system ATP-binding protein
MLETRGLHKSYGSRPAVTDLSLQIRGGEITGLLGPNGAGKSTTVAMLCGITQPDAGEVLMALPGASTQAMGAGNATLKRCIGVVPQDVALFDELPARANLELFGSLYGLDGARLRQGVDAALAFVGLTDRAKDKPAIFSGGMKRRLNIACALVHDPQVLLFDEPTVGVDPQSRNAIFDNLEALRAQGKALLYATHYMEEAERLCDRIIVMDHGRVVASDTLTGLLGRLPVSHTLTLAISGQVDVGALGHEAGVQRSSQQEQILSVAVADLVQGVPTVLSWLASRGHAVTRLDTTRANLEDVFLTLTGRQLRD